MLKIPKDLFENKRLPNMGLLLNATNYKKSGYDRVYGYGQEGVKKSWWKRLLTS